MNGKLASVVRGVQSSWKLLTGVALIMGFLLTGWTTVRTVVPKMVEIPVKVDSLKVAHDTQTAIMRRQEKLARCQVILSAPPELRPLLPRDARRRCLNLAAQEP